MAILTDVEVDKWTEHATKCTACGKVRNSKEENVVGLNGLGNRMKQENNLVVSANRMISSLLL